MSNTHGVHRKLVYDDLGRPLNTRTSVANGPSVATAVTYSNTSGRLSTFTYPTGLTVSYGYTPAGFLEKLILETPVAINPLPATAGGVPVESKSLPSGTVLWQAQILNAWGNPD